MLRRLLPRAHPPAAQPTPPPSALAAAIEQCERELRSYERRQLAQDTANLGWQTPGALHDIETHADGLRLSFERGVILMHWRAPDALHVRLTQTGAAAGRAYPPLRTNGTPLVECALQDEGDSVSLATSAAICSVHKHDGQLRLALRDGTPVCADFGRMAWQPGKRARLTLPMRDSERWYGLGIRHAEADVRGQRILLWNLGGDGTRCCVPFALGVTGAGSVGILWRNPARGWADCGAAQPDDLIIQSDSDTLDYILIAGATPGQVIARGVGLPGAPALPPLWALGYQHAVDADADATLVHALAAQFRRRAAPCDALHLGASYMDGERPFTIDAARFPAMKALIDELHADGFQVVAGLHPAVQANEEYPPYLSGSGRQLFISYPDGQPVRGAAAPGISLFPDFTREDARAWWSDQMTGLVRLGIDGVMLDDSEPSILRAQGLTTLPDAARHAGDVPHTHVHNTYGLRMADATRIALEKNRAGLRYLAGLPSGWAGSAQAGFAWVIDLPPSWEGVQTMLRAALNASLSCLPVVAVDVSGRLHADDGELHARWLQAACLMPGLRGHAARSAPWAFGQPYEVINRVTLELRYRLLPYLYSCIAQAREYGLPIIRPLWLAQPGDEALAQIDDAYQVGDHVLVAPVLTPGARQRTLTLPDGVWYDYWTNERYVGGETIQVFAPLEQVPLFVRAGAALPMAEPLQYINERAPTRPAVRIFPGSAETTVYEDHGEGTAYLHGEYRWTYFTCTWDADTLLTISHRHTGAYAPPYKQVSIEVVGLPGEPLDVRLDRQGAPLWYFDRDTLELVVTDDFGRIEIDYRVDPDDPTRKRRES